MAISILKRRSNLLLRLCDRLEGRFARRKLAGARRAGLAVMVALITLALSPTRNAQQMCPVTPSPDCPQPPKVDLAFILDRSGSMDEKLRGQTYNIQIEGVRRALLDPGVIPRDGSIAVAVFTFAGGPTLRLPFIEIKSATDAEAAAGAVAALKCKDETCPQKGPNPESNCGPALIQANEYLIQNRRPGARRVLLVSTDGQFSDKNFADASEKVRQFTEPGVSSEIDVILIGFDVNEENAKQIVFPGPDDPLPGAILRIAGSECNQAGAPANCSEFSAPEVLRFAEHVRDVIRSSVAKLPPLIVRTEADPDPGTSPGSGPLSLRQAIELANCNGGGVIITFADNVNTISLRVPLPALTAPAIRIDGLAGRAALTLVTIDGAKTDATSGEHHGDGILIRSTRDEVHGMRIINFPRAGVGIGTGCATDNVGSSLIKLNTFENNKQAGVSVIDPQPSEEIAVFHNVGNTISMNDISGSATPIDLALDGPTPNDPGDLDEGPNTLLNFPDELVVSDVLEATVTASGVTLAGKVSGLAAAGATVEIFRITSFKQVSGSRVIDGVSFLEKAQPDSNGRFSVSGLGDSPTCAYTATVTDSEGNTSELRFPCSGFAKAQITSKPLALSPPDAEPGGNKLTGEFTVENVGCESLVLSSFSVSRTGLDKARLTDLDDSSHFSMDELTGKEFEKTVTIGPGQTRTLRVSFDPKIPRFTGKEVAAADTLPNVVTASLTLNQSGCAASSIELTARVQEKIFLIDPDDPQAAARVILQRSGDLFTVTYFIFDSNLKDIQRVDYKFLKGNHKKARVTVTDNDLTKPIDAANLPNGKSIKVIQTFSGAAAHPNVASVVVTVMGRNSSDTSTGTMQPSSTASTIQSLASPNTGDLILPAQRLVPGRNDKPLRTRERPGPMTPMHSATRTKAVARLEEQR